MDDRDCFLNVRGLWGLDFNVLGADQGGDGIRTVVVGRALQRPEARLSMAERATL